MHLLTAHPHWYRTAFGPLTAAFWTGFAPQSQIAAEARFLAAHFERGHLLDVACGAGRHARALGRLGFRVHGLDISPHMLASGTEPPVNGVVLEQGDMTALEGVARYDGAYCWGNSFGYVSDADSREFLRRLARALRPGARFILETGAIAENILASFRPRTALDTGGFHFLAERHYEMGESAMHIHYRIERGEECEAFVARQCVYTVAELSRMAADAGLVVESLHGGIDGEPAALGKGLIAVFRRG